MPTIKGRIIDQQSGRSIPNAQIILEIRVGKRVILELQADAPEGQYEFSIEDSLFKEHGRQNLSASFQVLDQVEGERLALATDARVDKLSPRDHVIDLLVDRAERRSEGGVVYGKVLTSRRTGAAGVTVVLYQVLIGGGQVLGKSATDAKGAYSIAYSLKPKSDLPDLQIAALDPGNDEEELGRSPLRMQAGPEEKIDLILSARKTPPRSAEFNRVREGLRAHMGEASFTQLEENGRRRDITYLSQKSGWDARLVAMTALAHEFGEESKIPADLYYALFRAGIPTDRSGLNRVPRATLEKVWSDSIEAGIIDTKYKRGIKEYAAQYAKVAATSHLGVRPGTSVSTYGEMLNLSLGDDAGRRALFMEKYLNRKEESEAFWKELEDDFEPATVRNLRLDGKLGFLTYNNAPLMGRLRESVNLKAGASDLVRQGLYRPESWKEFLGDDIALPEKLPGKTDAEKRNFYQKEMAAQLHLSFPEVVLAEQIKRKEISFSLEGRARNAVTSFLNADNDFRIGGTPIERYLRDKEMRLADDDAVHDAALAGIKQLQRVYQLTPSDEAMEALLSHDLDSAYAIVQRDEDGFVEQFAEAMGGEQQARMTYAKAQQVHGTVLNLALAYGTYRRNPAIYAISSTHSGHDEPGVKDLGLDSFTSDVLAYPTLEALFGEMDFCECKHCRSVLSPAAYLVDLLNYIDRTENLGGKSNPVEILIARRPDIQHLALTCENTNTVLPYIDLVNEILEHQVVNGNLSAFEGFNTDPGITTEELLANPQFVNDAAYAILAGEVYPLSLPYNDALVGLRGYLDHLEQPLSGILETLRSGETLPDHLPAYQEYLGLSPEAFDVLTGNAEPLPAYFGMQPADNVHNVLGAGNDYARALSRKLGLSYKELSAIISTRWINPNQWLIGRLEPLYVPLPIIINFLDGGLTPAQLNALLPAGFDASDYGNDVPAWLQTHEAPIRSLTLLVDTSGSQDPCNFAHLEWLHSDGTPPEDIYYWKLLRFVRLWKALGWSIEQTDEALRSVYPSGNAASTIAELNSGMQSALVRLRHLSVLMEKLRLKPRKDLVRILPLWAEIGTLGKDSLYRRLFLNGAILTLDDVFKADDNGGFLQDATQLIGSHLPALQAALNVSAQDMRKLMVRLGMTDATPLIMPNVSALYRRAFLARALRISVEELEIMEDLTGLDPFAALEDTAPTTLRFVERVQAILESDLKIPNLDYYLRHMDRSGKASPTLNSLLALARNLRLALSAVEQQNTSIDDPNGDQARAIMVKVFGTDSADLFFGLLDESAQFTAPYDHSAAQLEPAITAVSDKLAYDDFAKTLSFSGVMTLATRNSLQGVAGVSTAFQDAVGSLFTLSQELFEKHPALGDLYNASFAALSVEDRKQHYGDILGDLLPVVLPRLKRLTLRQQLIGALGVDAELLRALLEEADIVESSIPDEALNEDLLAVETGGFTQDSPVAGQIRLRAHLDVPVSAFYNLYVETDGDGVDVEVGGKPVSGTFASGVWSNDDALNLTAGQPVALRIVASNATGTPTVKWASTGLAKSVVPDAMLYPPDPFELFQEGYLRLLKGVALAEALELEVEELRHFATFDKVVGTETHTIHWINALPAPTQSTPADATDVLAHLEMLLTYLSLRDELEADPEDLVEVLEDPAALNQQGDSLLWLLTGWVENERDQLLTHFGWTVNDLSQVDRFARLQAAYQLLENTGLSASLLLGLATNAPSADNVRELQAALRARYDGDNWLKVAGPIHDALRNRRRDVLVDYVLHRFSLNPASAHIDTANKLFEFFLIDVEMDACMKTSRIKQAISSVQLFIYRCFMNLEKSVSPKALNAKRWVWMKRYRVWEANRKVFLYPENWLDPELRNDKSSFFKEMESELLQSDITDEKAAIAMRHYLEKLDSVAKLEILGCYLQENQIKNDGAYYKADDIIHVIGRTPGANRKYYYRRFERDYWTPWEKIDLDIEDAPVLPVIWNDRLFLFWLSLMTKGRTTSEPPISAGTGETLAEATFKSGASSKFKVRTFATLCYSSYYDGAWQPKQTSDLNQPMDLGAHEADTFRRDQVTMDAVFPFSGGVAIYVYPTADGAFPYFRLYNTHSLPVLGIEDDSTSFEKSIMFCVSLATRITRLFSTSGGQFTTNYFVPYLEQLNEFKTSSLKHVILKKAHLAEVVFPMHPVAFQLEAPFFFQDRRHVFHVFPEESIVTVAGTLSFGYKEPEVSVEFEKPDLLWEEQEIFDPTIYQQIDPVVNGGLFANPEVVNPSPLEKRFADSTVSQGGLTQISAINFKGALIAATGSVDPEELSANQTPGNS